MKKNSIQIVCIIGDVYNKRNPLSIDRKVLALVLDLFIKAKICVYIIPGNHDDSLHTCALDQLKFHESKYIRYLDSYTVVYNKAEINIHCIPFTSKRWSNEDILEVIEKIETIKTNKSICLCHEMIYGATYHGTVNTDSKLTSKLLSSKFDLTIAGHVHKKQELTRNVHYCGAPTAQDFSDVDAIPGFGVVGFTNGKLSYEHIATSTRKFIHHKGSCLEIEKLIEKDNLKETNVNKLTIIDTTANINIFTTKLRSMNLPNLLIDVKPVRPIRKARKQLTLEANAITQFMNFNSASTNKDVIKLGKKILEDILANET